MIAISTVLLVDYYPTPNRALKTTMEQAFPVELVPLSLSSASLPVPSDTVQNTSGSMENTAPGSPATLDSVSPKTMVQADGLLLKIQLVGATRPLLVESENNPWNLLDGTNPPSADAWKPSLVQDQYLVYYSGISTTKSSWYLTEKNQKMMIEFHHKNRESTDLLARTQKTKYAVQLLSLEEVYLPLALGMVERLIGDGYYAYLYRTEDKTLSQDWYRIRVGFFNSSDEAETIGKEIVQRYQSIGLLSGDLWPVTASAKETSGEIIHLRTQRDHPWMIQMPAYSSSVAALRDIASLLPLADFAYLSEKQGSYRFRMGLFGTQEEAQAKLKEWSGTAVKLRNASVILLYPAEPL